MKTFITIALFFVVFCLSTMAGAYDFGSQGVVNFNPQGNVATAWRPTEFHQIMTVYYGNELQRPLQAPKGYVKMVEAKAVFNTTATAWRPIEYHNIMTAYGLVLDQSNIASKLGTTKYAYTVDGQVRFYKGNFAYTGWELSKIVSLYYVPIQADTFLDDDNDGVSNQNDLCPGTPVGAVVNTDGCWVLENKALFAFDSFAINAAYLPVIADIAEVIDNNPDMVVELDGHTDSKGSRAYNQKLSEKRAAAVKRVLVDKFGVLPHRITVVGYGEDKPIATNKTAEGRAKNRRVELVPLW